jgi:hypothetical protein
VSQLVLRDSLGVIDLVAQDDEGNLGELLHREEGVELGLGLGESLVVLRIDKEDDTVDLREVIPPDTASCEMRLSLVIAFTPTARVDARTLLVTAEIEGSEANVADGELLRGFWRSVSFSHRLKSYI